MKITGITIKGSDETEQLGEKLNNEVFKLRRSFQLSLSTRGTDKPQETVLEDNDIIELVFDDNTQWFANRYTLGDIFPESAFSPTREGITRFEVPTEIILENAERGDFSKALLKIFRIFTMQESADLNNEIKKLAAKLENLQADDKFGLFRLDPDFHLTDFIPGPDTQPYCLLIHGTASGISGSFGEARGTGLMKYLYDTYGERILAFQHRTLTENPLQNVRDLVKALPKNCVLHLITTSRGGLVGEVLSRFCNENENMRGFTSNELSILGKEYPGEYSEMLMQLIGEISTELKVKRIVVEKFIRIACPAAGTTLASKRMDFLLNFTFNLICLGAGIAANPVFQVFRQLIAKTVGCLNNVHVLPGLEVQNPDSPFIKVLNSITNPEQPSGSMFINNSLVVIAGNSKPSLKLGTLIILASKLFFLGKNDLVVDTDSMFMGTSRTGRVQHFFLEDTEINHFRYFENKITSNAILSALQSKWGEIIPGFTEAELSIGISTEKIASRKLDGGQVFKDTVTGEKPVVILLPGIMGSNLTVNDNLVWINYFKFVTGGLKELTGNNDIKASSLVSTSYKLLVDHLKDTYDVVTFPFDWRLSPDESADKLNEKVIELMKFNQPIKVIGHSMGGILFREFMVNHRETWNKLNKSFGFRLILLGVPFGGSFRIPAVLFGIDDLINKLGMIDLVHSKKELVAIFSGFKGILSLLPFSSRENHDFSKPGTWQNMVEASDDPEWPVPDPDDLTWFAEYRERMIKGIGDNDLTNAVYIAGRDKSTLCDIRYDEGKAGKELVFLSTGEGDYSVTWESGIPKKMMENDSVYYVEVTHGSLANEPAIFPGISEILEKGSTALFSKKQPQVRSEEKLFISQELSDFDRSPAGVENSILGLRVKTRVVASEAPVKVSISLGDLSYARYRVMAGHFKDDGILYAEKVIDGKVNNALSQRHLLGIYPGDIGTSEVIFSDPDNFKGTMIVGLGTPGNLTASELAKTVEQGVANYLLRLHNYYNNVDSGGKKEETVGISSLIIGCGYGGLSIESSTKAIILGVCNANLRIKSLPKSNIRLIEHIEFIELYEDKAVNCLYAVSRLESDKNSPFKIVKAEKGINTLLGSKKQIPADHSEGWWNRITVAWKEDKETKVPHLEFSISTGNAMEKVQYVYSNMDLMEETIEGISLQDRWTKEKAKALFEMLIPNDFKEQLQRRGNLNWIVNDSTASYPWELLQDAVQGARPICVSAGMIRQLATEFYRPSIKPVSQNNALIIADPDLQGFANQLPGALEEGKLISKILSQHDIVTTPILNGNYTEIMENLFCNDYKIIHLSGHGAFNKELSKGSGMVIGKNKYLSVKEIKQMGTTPELVFVNCCHLGKIDGVAEELYQQRYKLAANIGTQLISNGVRAVIAAGWAVNDEAALEFARVFYDSMFAGNNFGDSVRDARQAIYEMFGQTNTWGAYQCYGDPFYKFENFQKIQQGDEKSYLISQEAEVDLSNLLSELEIRNSTTEEYLKNLNTISKAVDKEEIRTPVITEMEALIYFELEYYDEACKKFSELLTTEDAKFSFSVAEKYCNARAKKIIADFKVASRNKKEVPQKRIEYLDKLNKVIRDLEILINLSPTSMRLNILASTYKRRALLSDGKDKLEAYRKAAATYQRGYSNSDNWYSLTNWLTLESALVRCGLHQWGSDVYNDDKSIAYKLPSEEEAIKYLESEKSETSVTHKTYQMNYWNMITDINIRLCMFILNFDGSNAQSDLDKILPEIRNVWRKAGSKGKRFAEIEHLEFVIDALSVSKNKSITHLRSKLKQLNKELSNLM